MCVCVVETCCTEKRSLFTNYTNNGQSHLINDKCSIKQFQPRNVKMVCSARNSNKTVFCIYWESGKNATLALYIVVAQCSLLFASSLLKTFFLFHQINNIPGYCSRLYRFFGVSHSLFFCVNVLFLSTDRPQSIHSLAFFFNILILILLRTAWSLSQSSGSFLC